MKFLNSLSLKRKLWIAVSLATLIPLVVVFYYISGYYISWLAAIILALVVFLGWQVIFGVIFSIRKVQIQGKKTLEKIGELPLLAPNEVENLESIIGMLSSKVRSSFEQLKDFSQKTEDLNREVSKKVMVLSTILEANDLFSKRTNPEEIVQFLALRLKEMADAKTCFCALRQEAFGEFGVAACLGNDSAKVENLIKEEGVFISRLTKGIILDKKNRPAHVSNWAKRLSLDNIAINAVISKGEAVGIICIGHNKENFEFSPDEIETLSLFSQNIALIWEHKRLALRVEGLEVVDHLTGLYNKKFLINKLDEEIRRAIVYQRPCGFLLIEISSYDDYQREFGIIMTEELLRKASEIFRESLRPIDIKARMEANRLAAIIIEKNKRQTLEAANNIMKKLEFVFKDKVKFCFSVAENPIDGTTADELIQFTQSQIGS